MGRHGRAGRPPKAEPGAGSAGRGIVGAALMEKAGVPISIISKWAGHYDSSFTMKTYVHASDDDLKQGRRALAKIHRIIRSCERL
jgi:integrase